MTDLTHPAPVAPARTGRGPSAPLLVGGAILLSTGYQLAVSVVGLFVASDAQIHAKEGVLAALSSIAVVSAVALVIAFATALATRTSPSRARVGAIVLGALAVLALPAFWSGAPAIFGATAAWTGGLTRGSVPQRGAGRAFAIIGLVMAVLDVVAILVLTTGALVQRGYASS